MFPDSLSPPSSCSRQGRLLLFGSSLPPSPQLVYQGSAPPFRLPHAGCPWLQPQRLWSVCTELSLITLHWFLTAFASVVHIKLLLRLWDLSFYEGSLVLFQTTLGMLRLKVLWEPCPTRGPSSGGRPWGSAISIVCPDHGASREAHSGVGWGALGPELLVLSLVIGEVARA